MELAAKILLIIMTAANFVLQALYFTHIAQLNSYRPERYRKWCRDNDHLLVNVKRILPFACILLMWLYDRIPLWILFALAAAVLLITALLNLPKKAKKPLVFTARVWRLLGFEALFLAVAAFVLIVTTPIRTVGFAGLFSIIIWWWVELALRISVPLENAIAKGFIKDARRILAGYDNLTVVGITGSYGKTSVKTFLHALLSVKFNTLMTPGNFNTTLGVVRTVREQLRPSHEVFLVEMGAKQTGDIREICELVHPQYGIISAIGEQHLETFGSIENIIATKFELADALPADGLAVLNFDNEYIRARVVQVPYVSYGAADGSTADYAASDIAVDIHGSSFTFTTPDGESKRYTTALLGRHTIQNLAGCMALAHKLGVTLDEMVYPIRMLKPVEHRLQLLPNGFIDDAYNSNPAGFRSALDTLAQFDARRVLVTPGMVELGEREAALNEELGAYAADKCDIAVLVGERQAPPLKAGLLGAGFEEGNLYVAKNLNDALQYVRTLPPVAQQIVLLENDLPDNWV